MKTIKSRLRISGSILLFLALSLAKPLAQTSPAIGAPIALDPVSGLPISPPAPQWKDPNWKDPEITLTNVVYDGLPLGDVALNLSDEFKGQFDIIIPDSSDRDWRSETVRLRLKNVTASELFEAMNLLFEDNRTPLSWQLKVVGHRQIALLRVLVDPAPRPPVLPQPAVEDVRRVYFVGDMVGDEKTGGMPMEQIIKTITDVWRMANASGGNIQFHKDAQLLVVTGNPSQVDFMEQTLKALRMKVDQQRIELAHPERYPQKSQPALKTDRSPAAEK